MARLLLRQGHSVSGSDQTDSHNLKLLREDGMKIVLGHQDSSLPADAQLVVHTTAIGLDNPELVAATRQKIPTLTYPQAIGKLTEFYHTISVCGTHGKTTVTALLGHTLAQAFLEPTVIVGSLVKDFGNSNLLVGKTNGLLVLESCEYQEAFLHYSPEIVLLNNIDPEHLDYYKTAENYFKAFGRYIQKIPPNGLLLANGDDTNISSLLKNSIVRSKTIKFGREAHNDVRLRGETVWIDDKEFVQLDLQIPGDHNLLNATAVVGLCHYLKISPLAISTALKSFRGAARRLELKGKIGNTVLYDDYGHAPAEIRATLAAIKSRHGSDTKILCIFQPHQYSRTRLLFDQFCQSFDDAAAVFIPNIFRSRDSIEDLAKMNVELLVDGINGHHPGLATNTINFAETIEKSFQEAAQFQVIVTMGAGDINRVGNGILAKHLKEPLVQS